MSENISPLAKRPRLDLDDDGDSGESITNVLRGLQCLQGGWRSAKCKYYTLVVNTSIGLHNTPWLLILHIESESVIYCVDVMLIVLPFFVWLPIRFQTDFKKYSE